MGMVSEVSLPLYQPSAPSSIEQTGLPYGFVVDLALRHAYFEGTIRLETLAQRLKLNSNIVHALYWHLHKEQLCDTRAMVGEDYEIALTAKGRAMADVALKKTQYIGPAPVPLEEYNRAVTEQGLQATVTRESLKSALEDLVVPEQLISELGAALSTGGTILLHGGTGNGKTSIAERLHRLFHDCVYIPYAVAVSGQILTVFDGLLHEALPEQPETGDRRWVLCRRPVVKAGGELRAEMLEPRVDDVTRVCVAPLQMKANNGILLIDDFGRQHITPHELLNRWIVPLDRRTDILTLWSGASFEIPFEMLVVFATNLGLSDLAEGAFMRRLKNKIKVEALSEDLFRVLIRRVCKEKEIPHSAEMEDYMLRQCLSHSPDGLRACYPIDIMTIMRGFATFEKREASNSKEEIDHAVKVYFGI
jgi:predicted ATPase with chaperone activity